MSTEQWKQYAEAEIQRMINQNKTREYIMTHKHRDCSMVVWSDTYHSLIEQSQRAWQQPS